MGVGVKGRWGIEDEEELSITFLTLTSSGEPDEFLTVYHPALWGRLHHALLHELHAFSAGSGMSAVIFQQVAWPRSIQAWQDQETL